MTESEWQTCADPAPMLAFLRRRASERKLRLFAVACSRRMLHLVTDDCGRRAVALAERLADGRACEPERAALSRRKPPPNDIRPPWRIEVAQQVGPDSPCQRRQVVDHLLLLVSRPGLWRQQRYFRKGNPPLVSQLTIIYFSFSYFSLLVFV